MKPGKVSIFHNCSMLFKQLLAHDGRSYLTSVWLRFANVEKRNCSNGPLKTWSVLASIQLTFLLLKYIAPKLALLFAVQSFSSHATSFTTYFLTVTSERSPHITYKPGHTILPCQVYKFRKTMLKLLLLLYFIISDIYVATIGLFLITY